MILRRIGTAIKKQDWFVVLVEILIVVFGVFIGLQVDDWNQARIDKTREIEYLQALGRDLEESLAFAEETIESLERIRGAQAVLADHIQGIQQLDFDELDKAIHRGLFPLPELEVSMPTYDELKTTGAIRLLKDRRLRFALQELESRLEQVRQAEADKAEIFYRFSDPYLIEHFNLNTHGAFANEGDESRPFVFARQDPPGDPGDALRTNEFKNILIYRFNVDGNQLQSIRRLKEQYVKIEEITRTRLERLGVETE